MMEDILLLCLQLLVLCGVSPVLAVSCPNTTPLMTVSDACVQNMHPYKELAFNGELDFGKKAEACQVYQETVDCIQEYVDSCRAQNSAELLGVEHILQDQQEGFGQLCNDQAFFNTYNSFRECYSSARDDTVTCMDDFNDVLFEDPSTSDICVHISTLKDCVTRPIQQLCGIEAVGIFVDLTVNEVPEELYQKCFPEIPTEVPSFACRNIPLVSLLLTSLALAYVTKDTLLTCLF